MQPSNDQLKNNITDQPYAESSPKPPLALQIIYRASIVFLVLGVVLIITGLYSWVFIGFGGYSGGLAKLVSDTNPVLISVVGLIAFAAQVSIVSFWLAWNARRGKRWALVGLSVLAIYSAILGVFQSLASGYPQVLPLLFTAAFGLLLVNLWTRHQEYFH